jgi:TRAP transporter TAXI family solute receptor
MQHFAPRDPAGRRCANLETPVIRRAGLSQQLGDLIMVKKTLAGLAVALSLCGLAAAASAEEKEIRWGTSQVGSTGHKALVSLSELLNKNLKGYRITVQPTPGGIVSVKGYAMGQFEGYYGSDVAFYEYAKSISRFKGFKEQAKRAPLQSLWTFTLEPGMAIHRRDAGKIKQYADLAGKKVFTGPRPWDTRAQIERAFDALGVKHDYIEVDIGTAGSLLESGGLAAFTIYTNAESATAPWITEASLSTDWVVLNPSAAEIASLKKAGFQTASVKPTMFKKDIGAPALTLLPFFYGFHVGADVSADGVYQILKVVEANAKELASIDKGYVQVAADMVAMQRRGIESSVAFVEIHPGLAKYMKEKEAWDAKWDSRVAKLK